MTQHGHTQQIILEKEFFSSKEYKDIVHLGKQLFSLIEETAIIKRGDKSIR